MILFVGLVFPTMPAVFIYNRTAWLLYLHNIPNRLLESKVRTLRIVYGRSRDLICLLYTSDAADEMD